MLAIARLENGEPALAAELFVSFGGGESLPLLPGGWRAKYLEMLTRSYLLIGRLEEAQRVAEHTAAAAAATGLGLATAWAQRAGAGVALERGDAAAALDGALSSAALCESVGAAFEAGVSRVLAARALALAGERPRAVAELQSAIAVFEELGARRYQLDAERELRKLGEAVPRRSRPGKADEQGIASLSERELELARLVVDRKTNPEIAAALFLSQKTVESHLRNIFRKLGVKTRVELARAIERSDRSV
jgi:DNA-binding CsgD family transcriptional regulator